MGALLILLGIGVSALANVLHIIGLSTTHWVEVDFLGHQGLFRACVTHRGCGDLAETSSKLDATQAVCVIGCLLGLGSLALMVLYRLVASFKGNRMLPVVFLLAGCAACGFIILGAIIFATDYFSSDHNEPGYSFALSLIGGLGIAAGTLLTFIGSRSAQ